MKNTFFNKVNILSFALVFILIFFKTVIASEIEVYGISSESFQNIDTITPCYLDVAKSDINQINNSIHHQTNINVANLKNQYEQQFQAISASSICAFNAKELGIQKLPAIVFNKKYVLYGITDLVVAKSLFSQYKKGENNQ